MVERLGRNEQRALEQLARLTDENPPYVLWKTMFIGSHSASVMRRKLEPKGLVAIRKQNDGYRYSITPAGRALLASQEPSNAPT